MRVMLAEMLAATRRAAGEVAGRRGCEVAEHPIWRIEPIPFDPDLVAAAESAVAAAGGRREPIASGALHDAAEMARVVPAAMIFASSERGISHAADERSAAGDLRAAIAAFGALAGAVLQAPPRPSLKDAAAVTVPGDAAETTARPSEGGEQMSEWWDRIEALPLRVESYELSGRDREYGSFTRPSTLIHLRGLGADGVGEDVVYDVLDHIAHRDAGPVHDFSRGLRRSAGSASWSVELDLSGSPSPACRHRATTVAGLSRAPPSTSPSVRRGFPSTKRSDATRSRFEFVCSTRLTSFDAEAGSLDRADPQTPCEIPWPRLQARPRERLDAGADRRDRRAGAGSRSRPQGPLPRHPGRRRDRPGALPPR